MTAVPWLMPGVVVSILVGFAARQRAGSIIGATPNVRWLVVTAVGVIVSATLTPSREAFLFGENGGGSCDVALLGALSDASLNILLFLPLGVALGMLPPTRRLAIVAVGAIMLPFAIELLQLWLPALDRACQSADVVANLIGLSLGATVVRIFGMGASRARRRGDPGR